MNTYASTVSVGIAGASGYAGQELLRLLARHPATRVASAMTSTASGGSRPLPKLAGLWEGSLTALDIDALAKTDAVFLAVPEDASAELVPALQARGAARIFDLSGAFRLRDRALRSQWYPAATAELDGLVYGLTELARDQIKGAKVVSCPGCYPTAAALALTPLVRNGLLDVEGAGIVIDAKSGISGAGRTPSERTHFSEVHGSLAAYGVFAHRHGAEIEQQLETSVTFVPHLVPLDRGIFETIYTRVRPGVSEVDLEAAYLAAYAGAPFVRLTGNTLPELKHVAHTNFCDIGWKLDAATGRLVIVSCIDNLLKGASGQAVQNFNVAFGLDETAGLI